MVPFRSVPLSLVCVYEHYERFLALQYKYSVSNASYRHVNIGKARNKFSLNDIKYDSNGFHDLALADDSTLTDDTNRLDLKVSTCIQKFFSRLFILVFSLVMVD